MQISKYLMITMLLVAANAQAAQEAPSLEAVCNIARNTAKQLIEGSLDYVSNLKLGKSLEIGAGVGFALVGLYSIHRPITVAYNNAYLPLIAKVKKLGENHPTIANMISFFGPILALGTGYELLAKHMECPSLVETAKNTAQQAVTYVNNTITLSTK